MNHSQFRIKYKRSFQITTQIEIFINNIQVPFLSLEQNSDDDSRTIYKLYINCKHLSNCTLYFRNFMLINQKNRHLRMI